MKQSYASAGTLKPCANVKRPGTKGSPGVVSFLSVRPQPGQVCSQLRPPASLPVCAGLAADRPLGFGFAFTRVRAFTGLAAISVVLEHVSCLSGARCAPFCG